MTTLRFLFPVLVLVPSDVLSEVDFIKLSNLNLTNGYKLIFVKTIVKVVQYFRLTSFLVYFILIAIYYKDDLEEIAVNTPANIVQRR